MTRSTTDSNALCHKPWAGQTTIDTDVDHGRVIIEPARWVLPRVTPSDVVKYALLDQFFELWVLYDTTCCQGQPATWYDPVSYVRISYILRIFQRRFRPSLTAFDQGDHERVIRTFFAYFNGVFDQA